MLTAYAERAPALPPGAAQLLAEMAGLLEFQWSDGHREILTSGAALRPNVDGLCGTGAGLAT